MVRIKTAISSRKRKKRVLKKAKGQFGDRSKRYQQAKRSVVKGMAYSYRDRKVKKREIRRLWIARVNAACREAGINYSRFSNALKKAGVIIDRKMLAEIAVSSPVAFKRLIKLAKDTIDQKPVKKAKSSAKK